MRCSRLQEPVYSTHRYIISNFSKNNFMDEFTFIYVYLNIVCLDS